MATLTGWETGKRVRFLDFADRTYAFNGANKPQSYNGTAWEYSGIETDTTAPPGTPFSYASGALTGTYKYYVVPVNETKIDLDGNVSKGIPIYWGTATPTAQTVSVLGIPAAHTDTQATHWWIYRNRTGYLDTTLPDASQPDAFYFVAAVAKGTTSYADNIADSTLPSRERIDFDRQIPPNFKYGVTYAHRMWGAGSFPYETGTVTVNSNTQLIDLTGGSFPDGVTGNWFKNSGAAKKYRIAKRVSTTKIALEEGFVGTLANAAYETYRDDYVIWYSKYLDCEGWGPDGEENRYYLETPGKRTVTGLIEFNQRLLVFCIDRCYFLQANEIDDPDSVVFGEEPLWVGLGCVGGDACTLADGYVYFLSMRGLCRWSGSGQPEFLDGLGTEWLDNLAPAQLEWSSVAQDPYNGEIVVAVTGTGQTENSLEYSYDPATGGWWPDKYTHPGLFTQTRNASGKPVLLYTQGEFIIERSSGTNDLVPSGTVAGTVTSTSTLTMTDSTAAFYTTGSGLVEAYVHFFNSTTYAHKGSRRITINTATQLTWSATGAGGGALTLAAGDLYTVGAIWWYWKTPVMEVPAHAHASLTAHVGVEPDASTSRYLYLTETTNGTDKAVKRLLANKRFEQFSTLQAGQTMQLKIESRETNAQTSLRNVSLEREVRGGTQ